MAEGLFRHEVERRGLPGPTVSSAGTWAVDGNPATEEAVIAMSHRGIDISGHSAQSLTPGLLAGSDLVIVMTSVHDRDIAAMDAQAHGKVRYVKELSHLQVDGEPGTASLLAAQRPGWVRALDLDDPYGLPLGVYERTAEELARQIGHLAAAILPKGPED